MNQSICICQNRDGGHFSEMQGKALCCHGEETALHPSRSPTEGQKRVSGAPARAMLAADLTLDVRVS